MNAKPDALLAGAQRVEVFNSGLEVWLYDASFRSELKASRAFEEDADDALFEKAMAGFVKDGRIMAYQLMQDDSLDIAVKVGKPPGADALAGARWLEPQHAFLRLPSGRLVIESNDALTIRKSRPTDKGAELEVPPGDYLVTLYRIDWDALEADEIEWKGPWELVVLTGGVKAKPVKSQPAILPWAPRGPGTTRWTIADGAYEGSVLFFDDEMTFCIALDAGGVDELGLAHKSIAMLSVPALSFECVLVCVRGDTAKFEFFRRLEKIKPPAALAGREWAHCQLDNISEQGVFCLRQRSKTLVSKKQQNVWHPATLRIVEGTALERR